MNSSNTVFFHIVTSTTSSSLILPSYNSTCFLPLLVCNVEKWCQDFYLNHSALLMADALRTELANTLKRIELPVSVPAFGSRSNTLNIKRALLAGFFMQVK